MQKLWSIFSFFFVLNLTFECQGAIWGTDDRLMISKAPEMAQKLAMSVALLAPKGFVKKNSQGSYDLEVFSMVENYAICPSEKVPELPTLFAGCTGFLVADDLIATAGHCMVNFGIASHTRTPHCEDFVWIFDFNDRDGSIRTQNIDPENIVECSEVIEARQESARETIGGKIKSGADWALSRLNRRLQRPVLKIAKTSPRVGSALTMIGHPLAGPMMFAKGRLLSDDGDHVRTNLDAFDGNSGSPVITKNGEVMGILVRGVPDFISTPQSCMRFNHCAENGSNCEKQDDSSDAGEYVQKITNEMPFISNYLESQPRNKNR